MKKPKLMKRFLTLFVALPLVLALTSCMRLKVEYTLNEDGSGYGKMDVGQEKNSFEGMGEEQFTPEEFCRDFADSPELENVVPYDDGQFVGCQFEIPEAYGFFEEGEVQVVGDEIHFELTAYEAGMEGADGEEVIDGAYYTEFEFSITFPGEVLTHNGSSTVAGTTVTWTDADDFYSVEGLKATAKAFPGGFGEEDPGNEDDPARGELDNEDDEPDEEGESSDSDEKDEDSGLPLWAWIAIGGGGIVVVGLVVALILGSRKKKAKAAAQAQQFGQGQQFGQLTQPQYWQQPDQQQWGQQPVQQGEQQWGQPAQQQFEQQSVQQQWDQRSAQQQFGQPTPQQDSQSNQQQYGQPQPGQGQQPDHNQGGYNNPLNPSQGG